jgi:hypothetical protein
MEFSILGWLAWVLAGHFPYLKNKNKTWNKQIKYFYQLWPPVPALPAPKRNISCLNFKILKLDSTRIDVPQKAQTWLFQQNLSWQTTGIDMAKRLHTVSYGSSFQYLNKSSVLGVCLVSSQRVEMEFISEQQETISILAGLLSTFRFLYISLFLSIILKLSQPNSTSTWVGAWLNNG